MPIGRISDTDVTTTLWILLRRAILHRNRYVGSRLARMRQASLSMVTFMGLMLCTRPLELGFVRSRHLKGMFSAESVPVASLMS